MTYVLLLTGFKTDYVLFFSVKPTSQKPSALHVIKFPKWTIFDFQKNGGLKDPLEKAFSTSFVVFHERVIEEFCPEAGKEWF